MKYSYYYPDTEAKFEDYSNGCDPDPRYDFKDIVNPVDLIGDIKEENFIIEKELAEKIQSLKDKMIDGWAVANSTVCRDGYRAADTLIKYYEEQLRQYKKSQQTN